MGYKERNRGQGLVLFALALIGLAALGIDVGYTCYGVRHELQRCAGSGALGGASAYIDLLGGSSGKPELLYLRLVK